MSISQSFAAPQAVNELSVSARKQTVFIFNAIAAASLFVCACWLTQTLGFAGSDLKAAKVYWTLMSAGVAGLGTGFLVAAHWWFAVR